MGQTVGDFIIERLHQWGVRRMFGYPGDGINGVFGAMQRAEGKIEFIQARHEEWLRSWRLPTQNLPANWACALQPRDRGRRI